MPPKSGKKNKKDVQELPSGEFRSPTRGQPPSYPNTPRKTGNEKQKLFETLKNLFETIKGTCGEWEIYIEKQIQKLLDEKTYRQEFAEPSKREKINPRDVKANPLYIIPLQDEKSDEPTPQHKAINFYKNCVNLLINAQIFADALSKLHKQYYEYAKKKDWGIDKINEALETKKIASPIESEYFIFHDSLLAVNLNGLIDCISSAAKIKQLLGQITPPGTVDSLKHDFNIFKNNPLIDSFINQFDDWKNLIVNKSSRPESVKRLLLGLEKYLQDNVDALDVGSKTVDDAVHIKDKAKIYAKSKKNKRDLLTFLRHSHVAILASVKSIPQAYVTLEHLVREFYWETIYEINLVFRNIFEGIRHAETFYNLQHDALSQVPLWNGPIKKPGNLGKLEEIKRKAGQKITINKEENAEKKEEKSPPKSIYSIAQEFHDWVNKQGFEFESHLRFPYPKSGQEVNLLEPLEIKRDVDLEWNQTLRQLAEEKAKADKEQIIQAKLTKIAEQKKTAILNKISARMETLNSPLEKLCTRASIKRIKLTILAELKTEIQNQKPLAETLKKFETDKRYAGVIHHVWAGKTGKMLNEILLEAAKPQDRIELISIKLVRLLYKRENKSFFRTKRSIALLEKRIVALRQLKMSLSQPGFTLAHAKQALNAMHRHDYDILIKNEKRLIEAIEAIDKKITNVDEDYPNLIIGNRILKPIMQRRKGYKEKMSLEIDTRIDLVVKDAQAYVDSHPQPKDETSISPVLENKEQVINALKNFKALLADKEYDLSTVLKTFDQGETEHKIEPKTDHGRIIGNEITKDLIPILKNIEIEVLEMRDPTAAFQNRLIRAREANNAALLSETENAIYLNNKITQLIERLNHEIPLVRFARSANLKREKIRLLQGLSKLLLNHTVSQALDKMAHDVRFYKDVYLLREGRTGELLNAAAMGEELASTIDAQIANLRKERMQPVMFFGDKHRKHIIDRIEALTDLKAKLSDPHVVIIKSKQDVLMKSEKMIWDAFSYIQERGLRAVSVAPRL